MVCFSGMKLRIILLVVLYLTSCTGIVNSLSKPWLLKLTPPPGPPEYQAGYVDGCTTSLNEDTNNLIAMSSKRLYKHPVFNNKSNLYRRTWRSAYIYCTLWWGYLKKNSASFFSVDFRLQTKGMPRSKKRNLLFDAPPGPEKFRIGWKDGCDTGKAATGEVKHKMAFGFKKDARFIEGDKFNAEYSKGWETAFWYCQRYYDIHVSPFRTDML